MSGPFLDIYGLSRIREEGHILRFLDEYIDRDADEDRGDEELMIEPLSGLATDDWIWEPAKTLTYIISRGLDHPRRHFWIYLTSKRPNIDRVILGFTRDNKVVFGLSILDPGAQPENTTRAIHLLESLARDSQCHLGTILVEEPPPSDEEEFRNHATNPMTVYWAEFNCSGDHVLSTEA